MSSLVAVDGHTVAVRMGHVMSVVKDPYVAVCEGSLGSSGEKSHGGSLGGSGCSEKPRNRSLGGSGASVDP